MTLKKDVHSRALPGSPSKPYDGSNLHRTPLLCMDCTHAIRGVVKDWKYAKCALIPRLGDLGAPFVDGSEPERSYCSTERNPQYDTYETTQCGSTGKLFEAKPPHKSIWRRITECFA